MATAHELRTATLGRMTESIAKELNECLCAIVINSSACLRMLSANPPNVEGARETARRTIRYQPCSGGGLTSRRSFWRSKQTYRNGRSFQGKVFEGGPRRYIMSLAHVFAQDLFQQCFSERR